MGFLLFSFASEMSGSLSSSTWHLKLCLRVLHNNPSSPLSYLSLPVNLLPKRMSEHIGFQQNKFTKYLTWGSGLGLVLHSCSKINKRPDMKGFGLCGFFTGAPGVFWGWAL
jgi:hypothetical protein